LNADHDSEARTSSAGAIMTRRKFIRLAGSAMALANLPFAARAVGAQNSASASFGGPTPNSEFYITSYGGTPQVDASSWRLRIGGLVENPLELSYDDIKKLPPINETLTLECISNPPNGSAISNAQWVGAKLHPLLERAKVRPQAVYAAMHGADGYYTGVPVDELMRKENFLPYMMNGVALPAEHGYPLRLFIPGKYGMKQPKWITKIELVDREFIGYWEARGWSNSAWRKINSGFFYPRAPSGFFNLLSSKTRIKAPLDIVGWALAGPSGVRGVEVSTDGGTAWHHAELVENRSPYVWTVWKYHFAPQRTGEYEVRVRATDGDGVVQPVRDQQSGSGMSGQPRLGLDVTSLG
jgi:DMSO/TMAO reductase YedYZ molybdopterin-dependent catalytic subunit